MALQLFMAILYIQICLNINSIKQEQKGNKTFEPIFETPKVPRNSTPALQNLFVPLTAAAEGVLVILPGMRENPPRSRSYSVQGPLQLLLKISSPLFASLNEGSGCILLRA